MRILSFLIAFLSFTCNTKNNTQLENIQRLPSYPSASGIEYLNNHVYIIGDDAKYILILDSSLTIKDSITLYSFPEKKIPKATKPDIESIAITADNELLLLGSGSIAPYRNTGWLIDPISKHKDSLQLDSFYNRLKANGIDEINIEGLCHIPGYMAITNRGNKSYRKNMLIITKKDFWANQTSAPISLIRLGINTDSTVFNGVSGLAYSTKTDKLLITVSTEDTRNNIDDGTIGKSYLWIVDNISAKKKWKAINPNTIIDMEEIDPRFKGQKIESVCILQEDENSFTLLLAADNDNGSSTLFTLSLAKD